MVYLALMRWRAHGTNKFKLYAPNVIPWPTSIFGWSLESGPMLLWTALDISMVEVLVLDTMEAIPEATMSVTVHPLPALAPTLATITRRSWEGSGKLKYPVSRSHSVLSRSMLFTILFYFYSVWSRFGMDLLDMEGTKRRRMELPSRIAIWMDSF